MLTVRKTPCPSCPYRRDVPSGIWHPDQYAKLPRYDGDALAQATAGAFAPFHCHQRKRTGELCAGWAGCHDMASSLALRMTRDEIDPAVYDYASPVPLFGSGAEAAEHGMRDVRAPGPDAVRKMTGLLRMQAARRDGR